MDKPGITGILERMKRWFFMALAALTLSMPHPAAASAQTMTYEVYAGGIHALQATLSIGTKAGRYDIVLEAKTRGFLASLVPWEGIFESHGWVEKNGLYRPEIHKSTAIWRGEKEVKEYRYARDGRFLGIDETLGGKEPNDKSDTDPKLTQNTTDVLSASLNVFEQVAQGKKCEGEEEVFDGKRRFKQVYADKGVAELEPTGYNIFKGFAAECTVEIKPIAGGWSKKPRGWLSIQEQGRAKGTMPTVWVADLLKSNPAVPVKIRVATSYGVLFMHLAKYDDGRRKIVADDGE